MDFSEYTLVSFGDSFCFGEGVTEEANLRKIEREHKHNDRKEARKKYRKVSNSKSYTKFLEKILGFKSSINYGIPGSSNKRILNNLRTFTKEHHNDKCFYVIGLSHCVRDLIMTKINHKTNNDKWEGYDFIYNSWNVTRKQKFGKLTRQDIYSMPHSSYMEMIQYYRNDFTVILDSIMIYHAIVDHLKLLKAKYVIFDGINDLTYLMKNQNIANRVIPHEWVSDMMADDDSINFKDTSEYIKAYDQELINMDNPYYLNYYSMQKHYKKYLGTNIQFDKNDVIRNMVEYVKFYPEKTQSPISGDEHWNKMGHRICAELLADWIRKHYE